MTVLLHFVEAEHVWARSDGDMEWRCYCDAQVLLHWSVTHDLYDQDEPIGPEHAIASDWQVVCHNGHTLLLAHELADDMSSDTCEAPTTQQIVEHLASPEDVAAWLAWRPEQEARLAERRQRAGFAS